MCVAACGCVSYIPSGRWLQDLSKVALLHDVVVGCEWVGMLACALCVLMCYLVPA